MDHRKPLDMVGLGKVKEGENTELLLLQYWLVQLEKSLVSYCGVPQTVLVQQEPVHCQAGDIGQHL